MPRPSSTAFLSILVLACLGCGTATFAGPPSHPAESYVYVQGGHEESVRINLAHDHRGDLRALKSQFGDAFLWFLRDHLAYVIRDLPVLAKVRALFLPGEALEAREGALDRQEEELDRRQEALESRQEKLEERLERLEELEEEGQDVAVRRSALEKERAPLDREAQDLGQEQEKLAQQQEALAREQEKASKEADRGLEALITDALRTGTALRVDSPGSPRKR